ncbi:hypothetical protein ABG067_003121 [Albugo candida]|uniref:Superoxide dismutase copper/zinc binding domain-containing protein n=1 Tax=Albugo candida TaxID=65357 RepID=A0A024GUJ5_9STRA|nr:unnamed protein product [Albugo candida]|eukprot:CCI50282.1 unnamed protein product [Albugo candida]
MTGPSMAHEEAKSIISGELTNLPVGKHAFHINVYGDLSQPGGNALGGVFNPFAKNHGAPEDDERRVGSLGNITVASTESPTKVYMEDKLVKLIGPHSIIGRSMVIHENEDDCGKGGQEQSLQNGNAGSIIAFGVVGIAR